MGEHTEKPESEEAPAPAPAPAKREVDWGEAKDRFVGLLAGLVRWVCLIFALILVLHIVFVVADANEDNGIVEFAETWADRLSLGLSDLFLSAPGDDPKARVLVNYGIAAIVWLVISSVGSKLIRRVGGVTT
ncbi:MAG: hypothetical protein ACRDQF_11645 [Thermocrispum sp.]